MTSIGFAGLPGGMEILIILFILLLLFGAKRLPELSRNLGKSLGEFKKGREDLEREIHDVADASVEELEIIEDKPSESDSDKTAGA